MLLKLSLLMSIASSSTPIAPAGPVLVRPGGEGDLLAWLVAGPYPNVGALELRGTGFRTDYLGDESKAAPVEGAKNGIHAWRLALGRGTSGIDLNPVFNNASPAIGYAYTVLVSPRDQEATLLFGSDDGARVFLNGEKVFEKQIARGVKRDEERVAIRLRAGENRLLFKIEQGNGGWGLMARVVDADGKPIEGLAQRVDLAAEGTSVPLLRRLAGRPGRADVEALASYETAVRDASRWLKRFRAEAKAPERLDRAIAVGRQAFDQAAEADADRATAAATGAKMAIDHALAEVRAPFVKAAQRPGPLMPNVDPKGQDWVKPMPGGRYFVTRKGLPFLPLGYNHNTDWPELEQANPLHDQYDPKRTDRWFAKLADSGVNLVRLMVETPQSGNIEERPGVFRFEHMRWLDTIVTAAHKHGIRLMVTPYDTFWMNLRADASPYWAANGGPIKEKVGFLTDPKVMELQKGRMRWLIDRYGNLGTIFCWEIMNEIDLWWGASPEQIRAWADEMSKYVHDYQRKRWGTGPMMSLSMAEPKPVGGNAETAFRRPDFDFATMHLYLGKSKGPNKGEEEQAADDFADGVRYARSQIRDNRPVFDGESGPIDRWVANPRQDERLYHEMSWAHLMAGGAGPGLRWPYRNPHHLTPGMLRTLKSMRGFVDGVPWSRITGAMTTTPPKSPIGWRVRGFVTAKGGVYRIQNRGKAGTIVFPGANRIRPYDVKVGKWLVPVAGSKLAVNAKTTDVAIYVDR
ncbi:MAG: cellulase family glycosylhydrolase [Fimbriimonas sp.]